MSQLPLHSPHDSENTLAAIAHGPLGQQRRKRRARYQWSQTLREHRAKPHFSPPKTPKEVEAPIDQP